jgi:mRNA interferase MazF
VRRGELYRVRRPGRGDPKKSRVFAVVSRQALIDSKFSTVICAPIFSRYDGLATQVEVGPEDGLRHPSSIHCDALVSLPKATLTDFVGSLAPDRLEALVNALRIALAVEP